MAFEKSCFLQLQDALRKLEKLTDDDIKIQMRASFEIDVLTNGDADQCFEGI